MENWIQDTRYAVRVLRRSPAFTVTVLLTLALGVAANTIVFAVAHAALLRPLPYANERGLVVAAPVAPGVALDWRSEAGSFTSMAAFLTWDFDLVGFDKPERVSAAVVTANFFQTLEVTPAFGRTFLEGDDRTGTSVAVLSRGYARRHFGAADSALGRSISIDGRSYEIVGVMAEDVRFPAPVDLWLPARQSIPEYPLDPKADATRNRGSHYLGVVGRLKAGVTRESAQVEQRTIFRRLIVQYPQQMVPEDADVPLVPIRKWLIGDLSSELLILLGVVATVLLIGCANVTNLMLARMTTRQHELTVRTALGASAARIARQFLTESLLLAAGGGVIGILVSRWALPVLLAIAPADVQDVRPAVIAPVMLFAWLMSMLAALLIAVVPACQSMRVGPLPTLRSQRIATATRGIRRSRDLLVAAQCAASVALLILSGLLIRSFVSLRHVDPGFQPDGIYTSRMVLPANRYSDAIAQAQLFDRLIARIRAGAGTSAVAAAGRLPFVDGDSVRGVVLDRATPGLVPEGGIRVISPAYFEVMQQPVRRGRAFTERDSATALRVAVVNDAFARRYWPGDDPIGHRLRVASGGPWLHVVGLVSDVKHASLRESGAPEFYVPYSQLPWSFMTVIVRTHEPMAKVGVTISGAISQVDPLLPVPPLRPMRDLISTSLAMDAFETIGLSVFGAIGLSLALVGLYGVMSYTVSRRTAEFALRIAIGAAPRDITRLVLVEGARVIAAGVLAGAGVAVVAARLIRASLFGVGPFDPMTFALVVVAVAAVALGAAYAPARRAMRADPVRAMAAE